MSSPLTLEEWGNLHFDAEAVRAQLNHDYVYPNEIANIEEALFNIYQARYAFYLAQYWRNRPYTE